MTSVPLPRVPAAFLFTLLFLALPLLPSSAGQDGPLAVGSELPDFELESLDGEKRRPAAVRDGTALIVVFFRGAW